MESWRKTYMTIAKEIAKHSTCARLQIGCIIVRDGRILSSGYNGVVSGFEHCNDHFKDKMNDEDFYSQHHQWSIVNEIHAEINALIFAQRNGISAVDAEIYLTHTPCIHCAKSIIQSGIKKVYYCEKYDRDLDGLEFLESHGIETEQIK